MSTHHQNQIERLQRLLLDEREKSARLEIELATLKDTYSLIDDERSLAWSKCHALESRVKVMDDKERIEKEELTGDEKKYKALNQSFVRAFSTIADRLGIRDGQWSINSVVQGVCDALGGTPSKNISIRELQSKLPWTIHYHRDFRSSPMAHKDFGHALLHIFKAAGKLAALVNDAEHAGCEFTAAQTDPYVADMVVCALRMANTCPGRVIDLQEAVVRRIETKNAVQLTEPVMCPQCKEGELNPPDDNGYITCQGCSYRVRP